jgi:hypothetical protein
MTICECCGVNIATNGCDCCSKETCSECSHHFYGTFRHPEGWGCCDCLRMVCENKSSLPVGYKQDSVFGIQKVK